MISYSYYHHHIAGDRDAKLEKALQQLDVATKKAESSEKMIVWLNKQLTSIQLSTGGSIPSSLDVTTPSPRLATRESPKHQSVTPGVMHPTRSRLAMSSSTVAQGGSRTPPGHHQ